MRPKDRTRQTALVVTLAPCLLLDVVLVYALVSGGPLLPYVRRLWKSLGAQVLRGSGRPRGSEPSQGPAAPDHDR